jgi:hypothetical protein
MPKPNRAERTASQPETPLPATQFLAPPGVEPDPPRRRAWFLALSAAGVALWLLFLLWMALDAN